MAANTMVYNNEYDNTNPCVYTKFEESVSEHEQNVHYKEMMCLKCSGCGPAPQESEHLNNSDKLKHRDNLKNLCVLPKGHTGKCCKNLDQIFARNGNYVIIKNKLTKSIDQKIYKTPGNDDYVYKNRSDRLYCNALSGEEEKKIRNKNIKKKCAIPLKDASSPLLLAQSYLDWFTFIINIKGIGQLIDDNIPLEIKDMLTKHKEYLIDYYSGRKIFGSHGHTICVITSQICKLEDFADPSRDNRVDIRNTDIQVGHNQPRSDEYVSIRGTNLLPMSRRGNLLIGENIFTENIWMDEISRIIALQNGDEAASTDIEILQTENAALKAENAALKAELRSLKGASDERFP